MGRRDLEQALVGLRDGHVSLGLFFRQAEADLRRMAEALFKRWPLPAAISSDDLYQQMCLSICEERRDLEWEPGRRNKRGQIISILTYVLYHAHVATKRWLHGQRGAKRRSGKELGRFPICMSVLFDTDDDELDFVEGVVAASQDEEADGRRVLLDVYDKLPVEQAVAWAVYVSEGDEERAAQRIDASFGLGTVCRTGSIDDARVVVKRAVKEGREIARTFAA